MADAPSLAPLPATFAATRAALQRVAVHVLARRRHALVGRFGLRAAPGGIATPAAGPDHEVVRTSGAWLLRERTGDAAGTVHLDLRTGSLAEAASLVEVDLDADFSAGSDTPEVGDRDAPLAVDSEAARALADWYALGWRALDEVITELGPDAAPSVLQLWPEHFDAGCDVGVGGDRRTNLGASPGDAFHAAPYFYVGPWGDERPGDPAYWNAPFGAVHGYEELPRRGRPARRRSGVPALRRTMPRPRPHGVVVGGEISGCMPGGSTNVLSVGSALRRSDNGHDPQTARERLSASRRPECSRANTSIRRDR